MMHKTIIFFTFFLFTDSMANIVSWDIPSFGGSYMDKIALLGESSQNDGWVMLTRGDNAVNPQINWSVGALVYRDVVPFSSNFSFSTTFSFSITLPDNPTTFGQGLAFFISPLGLSAGVPNAFGLPDTYVAVVFDTNVDTDPTVTYPDNSRITVLANRVTPLAETSGSIGIDLTSGELITAWIDYHRGNLTVFLSLDRFKPEFFLLTVQIDFYSYLNNNKEVYIGFSALSIKRIEHHFMKSWSFQSKNDFDSKNSSHKKVIGGIVFVVVFVIVTFLIFIYLKVRTRTQTQYPLAEQEGVGDMELASLGQEGITDDSQVSQGHEQSTEQEGGHFVSQSEIIQEDDSLPSSSQSVTTPNVGIEAAEESTPESSYLRVSKRLRFFPKKFEGFQLFKP